MMWTYKHIVFLLLALVMLVSCEREPERQIPLVVNICLPADGYYASQAPRRIMGDPGTHEVLEAPKYLYLFIVKQTGEGWKVWKNDEIRLSDDKWELTTYTGYRIQYGDSIYRYNRPLQYFLKDEKPKGRIFAICSNKQLTLTPAIGSVSSLEDVLNLKFSTVPDSIQKNLQNIYSTPYNYKVADAYYCSYDCSGGNSQTIDLLLYHVAAKVDITWNVVDTMRINREDPTKAVRLTYMEARYLFNDYAYCFKPMRNEKATLPSSGYTVANIVKAEDEGLWWEGRTYFYTIPYVVTGNKDYFPLQMRMETNGSGAYYRPTIQLGIDTSTVFVPWLRANFNITAPLEDKEETKTAE